MYKLYFAPLHGIGKSLFRNVYFDFFGGFDKIFAPFTVTVRAKKVKYSHLKDILPENNRVNNLIPQILGNNPKEIENLCKAILDLGYKEINWNLGCPFGTVANKKRGSGLLPYPDLIKEILDYIFSKVDMEFSVKTRLGRRDKNDIFNLIPIFNYYPVKEIIVHPRIGVQMYRGNTDLDAFEQCLPLVNKPLVYNGDIRSIEDFVYLTKRFPKIDRFMIGRGAIQNPFLADQINNKTPPQNKSEIISKFYNALYDEYSKILFGPGHLLDKMKEVWGYMNCFFPDGNVLYRKMQRTRDLEEYKKIVDNFFGKPL